ncbi:helix-turn-helix transcriptional regulator [Streptomyces sp. BBFR2]|uniref:helix-turn-helix domain-containing protein n=1 Tax=Streptomyces sp. BBFR2 TaxID=3372854 RepID=UPI0037DA3430
MRRVRLSRRLTQKQLGTATGYSHAYVSMVEAGKVMSSMRFARGCDLAFGADGRFEAMLARIDEGNHPSWFVPYLNLEREASQILMYATHLVPGMVQTADYARAVLRAAHPQATPEGIEDKVAARLRRREALEREKPPFLWVILHEASLRTVVGGPEIMAGQLGYLLSLAGAPYFRLQVMPFSAGIPGTSAMPFVVLCFPDAPTVLYTETRVGGRLHDSVPTVEAALDDYDVIRTHALSPDHSLDLIRELREEYRA